MNNRKLIKKLGLISFAAFGMNSFAADVKPTAMLDTNYIYNFNRPGVSTDLVTSPQNKLRYNDRGHNQFNLNQAAIGFTKENDPVGFSLVLWAGTETDVNSTDSTYKMLKSANFTYGDKGSWSVQGGKFGLDLSFENSDSHDNWNYSRSFGYQMLPTNTLGVNFMFPLAEAWSMNVIVGNGADRHLDNNVGKLLGLNFVYGAGQATEANLGITHSPERDLLNGHQRTSLAFNMKHMYSDDMGLGFAATLTHGRFEQVRETLTGTALTAAAAALNMSVTDYAKLRSATRWTAALYGMKSFKTDHQTALRVEYAKDAQAAFVKNGASNTLIGATLTHKYLATSNLSFWGELRWDHANHAIYSSHTNSAKTNLWTLGLAATLSL